MPIPMDSGAVPLDCPGVDNCPPSSHLHVRVARLQESVEALSTAQARTDDRLRGIEAGHVYLADQMAEVVITVDKRIGQQAEAMRAVQTELQTNTSLTRESMDMMRGMRDVLVTGRTMGRLARWLAPTLVAAAVSVGVLKGWAAEAWHGIGSLFSDSRQ